jgi:hypothetical protein
MGNFWIMQIHAVQWFSTSALAYYIESYMVKWLGILKMSHKVPCSFHAFDVNFKPIIANDVKLIPYEEQVSLILVLINANII